MMNLYPEFIRHIPEKLLACFADATMGNVQNLDPKKLHPDSKFVVRMPSKREVHRTLKGKKETKGDRIALKFKTKELYDVEGFRTFRFTPDGFFYSVAWDGYHPYVL